MAVKRETSRPFSLWDGVLLAWIAGTALFFFLRFSIIFYNANQAPIREALNRLFP